VGFGHYSLTSKIKRLQFINAGEFLGMLSAFRILWISGRFGGGKTSLAAMLAAWLLANGKVESVVSNLKLSFSTLPVTPLYNAAVVLDESWIYLDDRSSVTTYAAFVRKFNHYLLLPSVWPPHNRFTFLSVQRVFNGYAVGLPMWFYRWQLGMRSVKEKGYFAVANPAAIFGHYDTEFVPVDDGGISDAIKTTGESRGFKGKASQLQPLMLGFGSGDTSEAVDAIEDASFDLQEAVTGLEQIGRRISKR
jgi:hypothetical protein